MCLRISQRLHVHIHMSEALKYKQQHQGTKTWENDAGFQSLYRSAMKGAGAISYGSFLLRKAWIVSAQT